MTSLVVREGGRAGYDAHLSQIARMDITSQLIRFADKFYPSEQRLRDHGPACHRNG